MYSLMLVFFSIVLESFPISSSGNILLLKSIMQMYSHSIFNPVLLDALDYLVHGVIACVVAVFFFKQWIRFFITFPRSLPIIIKLMAIGCIIESVTMIWYVIISSFVIPLSILSFDFLITSVALLSLRYCTIQKKVSLTWCDGLIVGLAQGVSLLPGISRFGMTFVVARWLGFANEKAFGISFLIGWPINIAAFVVGFMKLYQHNLLDILNFSFVFIMMIAGSVSLISFYCVSRLIRANKLWIFSGYTMVLALIVMLMR
jgi:undecaprenyl-diphosphatase